MTCVPFSSKQNNFHDLLASLEDKTPTTGVNHHDLRVPFVYGTTSMTSAYFLEGRNPDHVVHSCGKEFASTGALGCIFCFPKANLVNGKSMCTKYRLIT